METLTIGKLARETGCKVTTIRYYEEIGLIPAPARSAGGTRRYHAGHRARLGFIRHCRELGFDQAAIRELLALKDQPEQSCDTVTEITRRRMQDVDSRIRRLLSLRRELAHMIDACDGGRIAECRLIEVLDDHTHGHCLDQAHGHVDVPAHGSSPAGAGR